MIIWKKRIENKIDSLETEVKELKTKMNDRFEKVEGDIAFLREEMRLGFNTLNTTLQAMFNITA